MITTKYDALRRKLMTLLTRGIGSKAVQKKRAIQPDSIHRILIVRPNHRLGNQLLITPLVQEVTETFPDAVIDLFAGKVAPILFQEYSCIDRIISLPRKPFRDLYQYLKAWFRVLAKRYDLVINVATGSSSGRLATSLVRSKQKFFNDGIPEQSSKPNDYGHNAKNPVYNLRHFLSERGIPSREKPVPCMSLRLSEAELKQGKTTLESLVERKEAGTICLYTFATGAKCYSEAWWGEFYEALQKRYPQYNLFELLPVENVSMIGFKAPSLYSKDVREMAAVMANTSVFVGADCGVMHLASASGVPSIGFFSITNPTKYGPYNRGSKGLITNEISQDDILLEIDRALNLYQG